MVIKAKSGLGSVIIFSGTHPEQQPAIPSTSGPSVSTGATRKPTSIMASKPDSSKSGTQDRAKPTFNKQPEFTRSKLDSKSISCKDSSTSSRFKCDRCGREYELKSSLARHYKDCGVRDKGKCQFCKISFNSFASVRQHERRAHPELYRAELEAKLPISDVDIYTKLADIEMKCRKGIVTSTTIREMKVATGLTEHQIRYRREKQEYQKYLSRARKEWKNKAMHTIFKATPPSTPTSPITPTDSITVDPSITLDSPAEIAPSPSDNNTNSTPTQFILDHDMTTQYQKCVPPISLSKPIPSNKKVHFHEPCTGTDKRKRTSFSPTALPPPTRARVDNLISTASPSILNVANLKLAITL
ncbi:hypothetical protein FQR65_LT15135 [Abscondita terminalis]|nr:hypothetical protein FQR65_LT15135 [Abscondita terminalis]